ncbi:hypothetical protein LIER_20374 [Lithospermum erythrorhizon]|uniref:Scarecrow-like protein 14 n=1 Tax=Lithospermum erythrorhizon TaxID=34254 RepID=A0AAV3QL87_LITER
MATDSQFYHFPDSFAHSTFINVTPTPNPQLSTNFECGLEIEDTSSSMYLLNDVFPPSLEFATHVQSSQDSPNIECLDEHESDSALKFVNQILMEESMDENASMFHHPLALEATEKSFYEVITKEYPPSPSPYIDINTECHNSLNKRNCESNGNSVDSSWSGDLGFHPSNQPIQLPFTSSQPLVHSVNSSRSNSVGQIDPLMSMNLTPSQFNGTEFKLQFLKGMEEAKKFLPTNSELVNLDKDTLAPKQVEEPPKVVVIVEKDSSTSIRGRKHLYRHDSDLDERSSKQSAVYENEVELSEMFDNLFLCDTKEVELSSKGDVKFLNGFDKFWKHNRLPRGPRNKKSPIKKKGAESHVVDLQSLLLSCAQAAAANDLPDAHEKLKQIKQYASSTGDACQRVANVFANGLEARLFATGAQTYAAFTSKRITVSEMLKAYQVDISTCPFVANTRINANKKILKIAAKGPNLHIVDFGISNGFQWPLLIQFLSIRLGGPPKLRITGIDFPQAGFRPAELIKETGQRLANHCKRFNVPFEYQAIERHSWETIDINDLRLVRDEVLVVNCLLRFQNLPGEEVVESPKDAILKLIRRMKPDLFLHSIVNGLHNTPFFMTRFREALFYYASLFDMLAITLPLSDLQRFHFEKEFGREVLNIVAREGKQRVVRPETYKQWQVRSIQAGFKIVPLEKDSGQRRQMEAHYHKDFLYYEDCNWMLQGWKGRVLYASSCWVPV